MVPKFAIGQIVRVPEGAIGYTETQSRGAFLPVGASAEIVSVDVNGDEVGYQVKWVRDGLVYVSVHYEDELLAI